MHRRILADEGRVLKSTKEVVLVSLRPLLEVQAVELLEKVDSCLDAPRETSFQFVWWISVGLVRIDER